MWRRSFIPVSIRQFYNSLVHTIRKSIVRGFHDKIEVKVSCSLQFHTVAFWTVSTQNVLNEKRSKICRRMFLCVKLFLSCCSFFSLFVLFQCRLCRRLFCISMVAFAFWRLDMANGTRACECSMFSVFSKFSTVLLQGILRWQTDALTRFTLLYVFYFTSSMCLFGANCNLHKMANDNWRRCNSILFLFIFVHTFA